MDSKLPSLTDPFCGGFRQGYMQRTFLRTTPPLHNCPDCSAQHQSCEHTEWGPFAGLTRKRPVPDSIPHLSDTPISSAPHPLILEESHPSPQICQTFHSLSDVIPRPLGMYACFLQGRVVYLDQEGKMPKWLVKKTCDLHP